jgi:hypothetical protein
MSRTGVLKSPMEILGVDLKSFVDSDGYIYTESMAKFAGERFKVGPPTCVGYAYHCKNETDSFNARKEWLKDIISLEVDDKVWVREFGEWKPRHFSHFEGDKLYCFEYGCTSFSTTYTSYWPDWRPFEQGVNPNER